MNMDVARLTGGLFQWLLRTAYPPRCVLCGAGGFDDRDLCTRCYHGLPWLGPACVQCAIPLPEDMRGSMKCGRCLQKPPAIDRSLSLFSYESDAIRLIHQLKFNQKLAHSRLLGTLLAEALRHRATASPDCILPVPLHRKRLKQRGYNQSIELARPVSRAFGIPVDARSIVRRLDTRAQTGLDRKQRCRNMQGAFEIVRPLNVQHVAILDDVVTTMSTVNQLAGIMKQSGVARVDVWSIARAL